MYTPIEKPKENKSRAIANLVVKKKSDSKSAFHFVDNRPEVITQKKIRGMTQNSTQQHLPVQFMVHGTVTQFEDYFIERFGADIMNVKIGDLRTVIDDTSAPEEERIRAESILIQHEPLLAAYRQMQVHEVLSLIRGGNYDAALQFVVSMMGINLHGATISSVKEWTDVVEESEVPRGGGLGLTLPGETNLDPPRIFIKQSVMIKWANTMEFGNLAATIAHEAVHAGQKVRGEATDDIHYKEFEAHANEICDAHYRILNSDKEFFPSGSHMETAHQAALDHWNEINFMGLDSQLKIKAEALKKRMDANWNVVRSYANKRDVESGLSESKVVKFTQLKDDLKKAYEEAKPLDGSDDKERLIELKRIAVEIVTESGRARGDMNENELKMIRGLDDEMERYNNYFNREWKFVGL